ncbi:hypothetical protein PMI14_05313 [Acidovorax sp. CF316]|uniref:hypothetical protein n=1 Tax=Acidovorax sp. CF316 TaxID=1144317 RepID=UPI00026BD026|nr:hypothetical protein [Acidovorax sp. CF316]EJE50108.1 hypothetical protein PMI14_05313 [Acidovorax sp. CF316]
MAGYTQDQITTAYNSAKAGGMSDADIFDSGAKNFGVTQDQFNLARQAWGSTPDAGAYTSASTPAPAPVPAVAAAPVSSGWEGGRDLTADEIGTARQWSVGKTSQEAAQQASGMGLTQKQFGQIYGWSAEDSAIGGYGTQGGLEKPYHDYTYDAQKGWTKGTKKPPTTGINLSQLQGATRWDVAPNETVRSQLQQIIADDSPLMQQARARALQTANTRGLLNSSMALTAADSAMYDAAMPIAQQDASTYARAGEFNANTANTFARDNNQFVRDAYMADFNVQANEWAAQQQFDREYKMLDRQQQLTLERDAVQNGYQSARDQFAAQNQMAIAQLEAASRAASVQPDTSVLRTQMQIDADAKKTNQQTALDGRNTLTNLRNDGTDKIFRIQTSDMSPEQKKEAIDSVVSMTNKSLGNQASYLGITPDSWLLTAMPTSPPTAAPSPAAPSVPDGDAGGGAGGPN